MGLSISTTLTEVFSAVVYYALPGAALAVLAGLVALKGIYRQGSERSRYRTGPIAGRREKVAIPVHDARLAPTARPYWRAAESGVIRERH